MVRGDTLKFQEKGVKDIIKDVFLPWYNAHRFLVQNIQQLERVRLTDNCLSIISFTFYISYTCVECGKDVVLFCK